MYRLRFAPILALLALFTLTASAATRQVQILCEGKVPAEAYYYDGKESHSVKLAKGQFSATFPYGHDRFALFDSPPVFDSAGRLQTTPIAYAPLPANAPRALVLLVGQESSGQTAYSMIAVPSAAKGAAHELTIFNLAPIKLGIAVDKETAQVSAHSAQTLPLTPDNSGRKLVKYQLRIAGQLNDEWKPLVMNDLFVRTDLQPYLLLTQPPAATGANASSGEPLAWNIVYAPGS